MKNLLHTSKRGRVLTVLLAIFVVLGMSSFNSNNTSNSNDTVTICHVPPGNPGNCHEITISVNALQTHLDHGDKLFCDDESEHQVLMQLVLGNTDLIIERH